MKRLFIALLGVAAAGIFQPQFVYASSSDEFCAGFEEGYKAIKGDMVIVPICPIPPITPIGSTPFREGIKAGMEAASE